MDKIPTSLRRVVQRLTGVGVLCLMASVMLSACGEEPQLETMPTDAIVATPTAAPTPIHTRVPVATLTPGATSATVPSPITSPTPDATFAPAPVPTAPPTPSATSTPMPSPTAEPTPTATPTPTPTPLPTLHPQEMAQDHLGAMLSWFESPPDQLHATASRLITDIWLRDAYTGDAIAQMPWIIDGITQEEVDALWVINHFFFIDTELGKGFVDSLWVVDGLNDDEFERVDETLRFIASNDSDLALLLVTTPWAADGLDDAEWRAFESLMIMGRNNRELTRLLAASSWVADGAGLDIPNMSEIIADLLQIAWKDSEVARQAATAPWVVDGVSRGEARVIGLVSYYLDGHPENSKALLDFPPAVEGLLVDDQLVYNVVPIAFWNPAAALTVARHAKDSTEDMGNYLTKSLTNLAGFDMGLFNQLIEQPWFTDGLDGSEAALIVTLDNVARKSLVLYNDLLTSHYVQHKAVSLPLSGSADIWVIQNDSPPPEEDLLKTIEDTARISEEFLGVPFPATDIILLVAPPGHGLIGVHLGTHMVLLRSKGTVASVPHETAHYYFTTGVGPRWLSEGTAQFIQAYVNHRVGIQDLTNRRAELLKDLYCFSELGIENIRHYNYYLSQSGPLAGERCTYAFGEKFLLGLYETMGGKALAAALADLYLSKLGYEHPTGDPRVEEGVYNILMKHTPADKQGAFRDVYRRLHGGPFAFPDTDFSDEYGDEPEAASTIAVGEVVEGALDYMFDFDYFRFQAEEGVKYRIDVSHRSLGMSSATLYGPDGLTEEKWNWKSRRLAILGPQILWVAPGSEDYYFAVKNFGGKTGSYTLTITKVGDAEDDHGDTLATATYASLGEVVEGNVDDDFDFDYFRFRVQVGSRYQLSVIGDTLEYFRIRLYASDGAAPDGWSGNQYGENSVSGGMTEWTAPSAGEYYLALDGFNENLGAYTFTITTIDG